MSWFEALAYAPFERANGMRLPPITAACRGAGAMPLDYRTGTGEVKRRGPRAIAGR